MYGWRVPSGLQAYLSKQLLRAQCQCRGNTALTPRPCAVRHAVPHNGEKTESGWRARCAINPFVLVNYSSTICLKPPADHGRFKSWPVSVGREKRCDGGPAKFQGAAQVSAQVSAVGGNPADGRGPASRRTLAWGLLRHPADPQPVYHFGAGAGADRGGHRASQGGTDAAAVGSRQ